MEAGKEYVGFDRFPDKEQFAEDLPAPFLLAVIRMVLTDAQKLFQKFNGLRVFVDGKSDSGFSNESKIIFIQPAFDDRKLPQDSSGGNSKLFRNRSHRNGIPCCPDQNPDNIALSGGQSTGRR